LGCDHRCSCHRGRCLRLLVDNGHRVEQLERLEGMRVAVTSLTVTGPTQGNINEANATATSTGAFYDCSRISKAFTLGLMLHR